MSVIFLNETKPEQVEGLQVGAVITYNDRANNSRGLVYEVGAMVKVAWTDEPGLSEVPANGIKYGWQLTGEVRPIDEAFAARDIAIQARAQRIQNDEQRRQERDAKTEQGRKILETLMPIGTKAAIIAKYHEDDCDIQTDYFNVRTTRTVLLGFSTHTRDLFSEMRKVAKASGFSEVQHLTEPNKEQEHREKYSMGRGYYLKDSFTYSTGWVIKKQPLGSYGIDNIALAIMEEGGNQLPSTEPEPPTKPPTTPRQENTDCTLRENPSKSGIELIFSEKPSAEIRDQMKNAGFRWHGRNGYWYAKDNDRTRALAEQLAGSESPTEQKVENVAKAKQANGNRLRTLADAMTKQIDAKFDPGVSHQNPTARRARIAESMRLDGEALKKVQSVLYGLADDIEAGNLPEYLTGIKSKAVITEILQSEARRVYYPESWRFYDDDGRLKKAGVTASNFAEVAAKLMGYISPPTEAEVKEKKIAELERDLIGVKIDGFFPTPRSVIDQMLIKAGIEEENSILEPSAGKGDIADRLREQYPDNQLQVIEINGRLRDLLVIKGHDLINSDFISLDGSKKFDRILMNPPFEKMADIDHIKHAYKSLKNGGRLVCLMSESPFFRSDRKAVEFRGWLDDVGGWSEKLEEGSFKGAESFRQTGVNMRMVIIDK